MLRTLKTYFGYDSFRPMQEKIIQHILKKKDALVLMPTGGGKSICYQLPALLMEGTAIIVSPLISLMKDQVATLQANGIAAAAINSSNDDTDNIQIRQRCKQGKLKLLYISPERLLAEVNFLLKDIQISLFAIDEAHCISQWGHDFRPEYTQLHILHKEFPGIPIVALTATADKLTREDIINQLHLKQPEIFISSFDRPNLSLTVKRGYQQREKHKAILAFIEKHKGQSGIIYCLSRNKTESVAQMLTEHGIKAGIYHAGLSPTTRDQTQEDFINDRIQIICATIAFGMGIDKNNVRWIIHYNMPKSIESFYQEIGRAGRDGMKSDTILFYSLADIVLLSKFANESGQSQVNLEKLNRMQQYAEANICRRRILLNYFGETSEKDCGNCDICKNPPERFDGTIIVQKALSAIVRTQEKIGTRMLIDILKGSSNAELLDKRYDQLKTYGAGRDIPGRDWQDYLLQMLQLGYLEIAYNENNHLKLTESGKKVLYGQEKASLVVIKHEEKAINTSRKVTKNNLALKPACPIESDSLFEHLRQVRIRLAKQEAYPAYIVLSDKVLTNVAIAAPTTLEEFGRIDGIGTYKKEKYGKEFVNAIKEFLTQQKKV